MIGNFNDETDFLHKLLFVARLLKAFANTSSANKKYQTHKYLK